MPGLLDKIKLAQEATKSYSTDVPSLRPEIKFYPHQRAAIDKLFENKGKLILAHGMGTGKTGTSILGFESLRANDKAQRALVVVPSGLRENYAKGGVEKFSTSNYQIVGASDEVSRRPNYVRPESVGSDKDYTIVSYEMFRRDPVGIMQRAGADTLILDEFHKARNEGTGVYSAIAQARPLATNFMGLTASMINNNPEELATLLTLSEGKRLISQADFKRTYTKTVGFTPGVQGGQKPIVGLTNIPTLMENVYPKVDYVDTSMLPNIEMPKKQTQDVKVPMSDQQYLLYQLAMDKLGPTKARIVRAKNSDITMKDANFMFTKIMQARQVSNSVGAGMSGMTPGASALATPKTKRVLDDTVKHLSETPDGQVVLYSNLVNGGIDVLHAGLTEAGVEHAVFVGKGTELPDGKVTSETRQSGVEDFLAGKKKVIVISGAGSEGLDLKNATAFYALDGHFNPQRILQSEARAVRLGGQGARPLDKRIVDVRRYMAVPPPSATPGFFGRAFGKTTPQSTDEWVYNVAKNKYMSQDKFYTEFKQAPKYLRKYVDNDGTTRYVYQKPLSQQPGMLAKVRGIINPGSTQPAQPTQSFGQQ